MSKRTTEARFRNVDVDQYNEDNFADDAPAEGNAGTPSVGASAEATALTEAELSTLLADGKSSEALAALLAKPPVNAALKDQAANQVLRVLMQTKAVDIKRCVLAVDEPQVDTLMKYVYRGFELAKENHAHLLAWHEQVLARGQVGCIVRVLADRKRV